VYRHRDIRIDELDQLHAHGRIHGHHQQRDARRRDRRAAEVNEHEVDGLPAVAARDLGEFGHEEGVPGDVDAVGGKGGLGGGWVGGDVGMGRCVGKGEGGGW
jgi:hypothetical protein